MDRGAWLAMVQCIAKSWTQLSDWTHRLPHSYHKAGSSGLYKGRGRFSADNYIGEMLSKGQAIIFTNGLCRAIFTVRVQEENKQHFPLDHRDFYVHSTSRNVLENTGQNQHLHFMIEELKAQRWEWTCRKSLGWVSRHMGCMRRASLRLHFCKHSPLIHEGAVRPGPLPHWDARVLLGDMR